MMASGSKNGIIADMARAHRTRTLIALVLLGIAVVLLASLGRWQLRRADERRAILAAIEAGRRQPPLTLTPATSTDDLRPWRPVSAQGRWRDDLTVLLDNRNQDGRPGYWIATPLVLESGSGTAVLVLRGWLPRTLPGQAVAARPALAPDVRAVTGQLVERVPRLFELWNPGGPPSDALPTAWPAPGGPPTVQNLDLGAYASATGLHLLPTVMEQLAPGGDGLVREWPQPSVDYNQNLGYAMQWFGFAAIAGIAFVVVAVRAVQAARAAKRGRGP
jgi:cytochrome oxidase assembly protein ShyY1